MPADPYHAALLIHVMVNTFGVCHSVPVQVPTLPPTNLFNLNDYRRT